MTANFKLTPGEVAIPDDLSDYDRWGVWRPEWGRKIPYRVDGRRASSTNPQDWGELDKALKALRTGHYAGLAFALFAEDGLGLGTDEHKTKHTPGTNRSERD